MQISDKGKQLIFNFEGCKLEAYQCYAGKWTIGYGNTFYEDGTKVKQGDKITQERAYELFDLIIKDFEKGVSHRLRFPVKQNQFDALVSHAYNCGYSETIYRMVNERDNLLSSWWISHYVMAGGKKLNGLVRRRIAERDLYFKY